MDYGTSQRLREQEIKEAYASGKRRILIDLLSKVAAEFGKNPIAELAAMKAERLEAVQQLRDLCAEHGDNDWPDELHLGDVIEKHLARHLGD